MKQVNTDAISVAAHFVSWFANAFVLWKLWGWVAVEALEAPSIGYMEAWGLVLIAQLMTAHMPNKEDEKKLREAKNAELLGFTLTKCSFILFFGYIASIFI